VARSAKDHKTNALRELDAAGLAHEALFFEADPSMTGVEIARAQGEEVDAVFKTLVTEGKSGAHYVFLVPVACELDLKKAAAAAGEKAVAMVRSRDLLPLTGYVHGGCSPIGMKKPFPIFFHATAPEYPFIYISAGVRGLQIRIAPTELIAFVRGTVAPVSRPME